MKWNPHQDMENRAYAGILTSLFPEQTKTLPRVIVWSIIFLLDLIFGLGGAHYFGFLEYTRYHDMRLVSGLLVAAIIGIFWLQGRIWYAIVGYFRKRQELD